MSVSVSAMVPSFFVMCLVVSLLVPFSFFIIFQILDIGVLLLILDMYF